VLRAVRSGRARLGLVAGAFFIGMSAPVVATAQVVPPPGSEVPIPPKPKTDSAAPKPDSIKPKFGRSSDPRTADIGPQYSWNREQLFASGALNVAELLERVPGTTIFRTGWINSQKYVAVNGNFDAVRVFYDGIELDNLSARSAPLLDLNTIQLWSLESVSVERLGNEVRLNLRSWQADRTTPSTRVDVSTGDEDTNIYRGFYGKRFGNGGGLQFAGQQFNTTSQRFGGGGDNLSVLARVGVGGQRWSVDGFASGTQATRTVQPTFANGMSIPPYESSQSLAYLRIALGKIAGGPWLEAIASNKRLNEKSRVVLAAEATSLHIIPDSVDTATTQQQYVLAAGFNRGPLAVSATERIRSQSGETSSSPSARFQIDWRYTTISAFAEHDGFAKRNRVDAVARITPVPFISAAAAVSRAGRTSDAPEGIPTTLSARFEGGVRVFDAWLVGRFLTRDTALLQPLRVFDTAYIAQPAGRRSGTYFGVRGKIYRAINADIIATQWAAADAYRPQYQVKSEVNLATRWLSRFPSGNFGIRAAMMHDYRSQARFPTEEGDLVTASSNVFSGLLEIRILRAVLSYQIRNMSNEIYQLVPGFYMHRVINLYGVRWDFVN
jgi:hypothetical protein